MMPILIFELLLQPSILDLQLADRLLLITNGLLQFNDRTPQFTNQRHKLIDAQLFAVAAASRSFCIHP